MAERRLAAIMFTDIVGSAALMADSEPVGLRAKQRHRTIVRSHLARYRGELIEALGDETLSLFASTLGAGEVHRDGVNIAARLEALTEAGRICVSAAVHESR